MTRKELEEKLQKKEQELAAQLEYVYGLAKAKAEMDVLQAEFKKIVTCVTEKYFFLFSILEIDKANYIATEYEDRAEVMREKYKEDLALLAVSLDEARGIEKL